ncbi:FecR domain-containing protein [Chitinophaga horti]|uniref:FecR domain-containing protein n=1 Tax=Chitinophaga horti TaxID=2920382 RepID=A0ABY6IWY5_9BACT|nr:FecR domain-containing protein [Chitinophaga horti]UYQ91898.1 FecR domain-containing protein [Chitinophaga horti]
MGIPDRHILDRYLKNTCTEEERKLVDEWYDQLEVDVPDESLISEEDRAAVKAEVWEGVSQGMLPTGRRSVLRRFGWQAAVAAAIFGIVVMSIHWWEHHAHRSPQKAMVAEHWDTVSAKAGKILHLTLDDGTNVWLKAGSTLSYPQKFAANERTVALLNGEAFLEVAKDDKRPFTLTSGECVTRVLGTSFNVRRYQERQDLSVSVITGKVQVATPSGTRRVLTAGSEMVKINAGNYVVKDIPPAAMRGAWKNGQMVFRQQQFSDIAAELEDYYAIKVNFRSEQTAKLRLTGRFSYFQSPDEILRSLCLVNGNVLEQAGNNYTISE